MKRLTSDEFYFLLSKDKVVSNELIKSWSDKQKAEISRALEIDKNHDFQKKSGFASIQMVAVVVFTIICISGPNAWNGGVCVIGTLVISWICIKEVRSWESPLTRLINNLQEKLCSYGRKEIRGKNYFLNEGVKCLHDEIEWILDTLAQRLLDAEKTDGPNSPLANKFRADFKSCHAVFTPLGLCDEDQGKWLKNEPEKEDKVLAGGLDI